MPTPPRITIVMPSLNQGAFIDQAIESVLRQDYRAVELIVVDGASRDGPIAVLEKHHASLTCISERDRGPAHALNKGFALATGDILGFLNADDMLLPGSLTKVAREFAAHADADVVSGHGYLADAAGQIGAPFVSDRWMRALRVQRVRAQCKRRRYSGGACPTAPPASMNTTGRRGTWSCGLISRWPARGFMHSTNFSPCIGFTAHRSPAGRTSDSSGGRMRVPVLPQKTERPA